MRSKTEPIKRGPKSGYTLQFTNLKGRRTRHKLHTNSVREARVLTELIKDILEGSYKDDITDNIYLKALDICNGRIPKVFLPSDLDISFDDQKAENQGSLNYRKLQVAFGELEVENEELKKIIAGMVARSKELALKSQEDIPTIQQALDSFKRGMSPTTVESHYLEIVKFIDSFELDYEDKITVITHNKVEAYCNSRLESAWGDGSSLFNRIRQKFTQFQNSINHHHDSDLKIVKFKMMKSESKKILFMELGEVDKMLEGLKNDKYIQAMIATYCFGGFRKSEVAKLKVKDVVFDKRGKGIIDLYGKLKTTASGRTVPINSDLAKYLKPFVKGRDGAEWLFAFRAYDTAANTWGNPQPLKPWQLKTSAGKQSSSDLNRIVNTNLPDGITQQWCRRTCGSLLLQAGCTIAEVASILGNSIETCEKHYAAILNKNVNSEIRR